MLSQALNLSVHPAKIIGTKRIIHATFRQPRSEFAVSILSLKKTPLLDARKSFGPLCEFDEPSAASSLSESSH